ncbi:MAG: histidine phosphatase family protein [Chloroflexota bacterium]|nr:histidine phosphatase family protein [Chloroflexota bacterium]
MKRVLLLRHVESEANKAGVGLGRTDSPPTALGLRQLDATVAALREEAITRVVTSPLSRARLLAEAIAESHGLEAVACDELLELDVGEMEGLEWPVARARYGKFLDAWRSDDSLNVTMPGGESLADVYRRSHGVFDELVADRSDGTGLIVTHNFVVKLLAAHALAMPPDAWRRIDTSLAGITSFRIDDGTPVLERLNDRHHVAGL